jgi:hypothetical protein
MPQLVKKRRSGWAVLAAGALVASLLAVGASPVGAAPDKADYTTMLSACVGDALDDHMFTDVSDGHAFKDAINCVAYYGVTNGTGDGSTYSPNQDVTRAEMAVFIARAAKIAGVELKSGSGDFSDIGDVWPDAQDAINGLAASGMIAKGGAFRPDDAVTRAEMASFLIALLAKAAPNVTIDSAGAIKLGSGSNAMEADDYFADSRASQPRANDAEISALYELGVTKGAGPAAVQDDTKPPLDFNYEPAGTVDRGQMAAFITRALAHTSVRPIGVSAQFDGADVVVSVRDDDFQPRANIYVDVFRTDTGGVDLAFRADGSCAEVAKISATGEHLCEMDDSDLFTGADGEHVVNLDGGVDVGGTLVWAWNGATGDKVDDDTDLYKLEIAKTEQMSKAERVRVSTENVGKAHLGSSVLYTVQLQNGMGDDVAVGKDGKKPAQFTVRLRIFALHDGDSNPDTPPIRPGQVTDASPLQITTDDDGKATFSVSGLADLNPAVKVDKYEVDIFIQPHSNAPDTFYIGTAAAALDGSGWVAVDAAVDDVGGDERGLVFSTEPSSRDAADLTVTVKSAAAFVAADKRGSSNRVTATVTDQYGDPIGGAKVMFSSSNDGVKIRGGRPLAVGRDGSITAGYQREGDESESETVKAEWDHDDDSSTDPVDGTTTVEWAAMAASGMDKKVIRMFDTETNTIFASSAADSAGDAVMLTYDSNDRFDFEGRPSSYAEFERELAKDKDLGWTIYRIDRSRATNVFHLSPPMQ